MNYDNSTIKSLPPGARLIGYARVSDAKSQGEKSLNAQKEELKAWGVKVENIYSDIKSSTRVCHRKGFEEMYKNLLPGDFVVVVRLDRIGRHIVNLPRDLNRISKKKNSLFVIQSNEIFDIANKSDWIKLSIHILMAVTESAKNSYSVKCNSKRHAEAKGEKQRGKRNVITKKTCTILADHINGLSRVKICNKYNLTNAAYCRKIQYHAENIKKIRKTLQKDGVVDSKNIFLFLEYGRGDNQSINLKEVKNVKNT